MELEPLDPLDTPVAVRSSCSLQWDVSAVAAGFKECLREAIAYQSYTSLKRRIAPPVTARIFVAIFM